jgi:hypothetical protein
MKQLIPLFLFLLPCLVFAQYQGNGNQKITLGEQSTADGLVYRGIRSDTLNKIIPLSDTSAYIILDTVENTFWHYKSAQIPKWQQIGVSSVSRITFTGAGASFVSTVIDSTTKPRITIDVPAATPLTSGVVTFSGQTFRGGKTFENDIAAGGLTLFGPQQSTGNYDRMLGSTNGSVGFVRITNGLTLEGDSLKNGLVLTTTGSSGSATFNGTTLNIPNYIPSGIPRPSGTVEAIYSGTGINVSPDPLTISGTINVDTNFVITRFDTSAMLSPYWKNNTFLGTLPVVNGGTGTTSFSPNNYLLKINSSGIFDTAIINEFNGNIGIGTSNPVAELHISRESGNTELFLDTYANSIDISGRRAEGTPTSPTAIISGANILNISARGYTGVSYPRRSSINFYASENWTTTANGTYMLLATTPNGSTNNTERIRIDNAGKVGIGTTAPQVQFHTTEGVRFATFAGGGTTTLSVDNTGNLARTSSIELKKDVIPITFGLNEILQIKPISFNWINTDKFGNENENGFIAEDVMSVIPNVVSSDFHGLFMDYTKLIPILTKAIQEQQTIIKVLEQRLLILENK